MPLSTPLFCWLRLVQTNFIPEITLLLLRLLVGHLNFTPQRRRFTRDTHIPFQANPTRQGLTVPIKRHIRYLVVVYDNSLML